LNYEFFIAKRIIGSKLGLQKKVREKVVAFNGHITINSYGTNESNESIVPVSTKQDFYPKFNSVDGIKHIQGVATKFGVIRTETDFEGIVLKGVGSDYDWSYVGDFLIEGDLPVYEGKYSNEVVISSYLANRRILIKPL